MTNPMTLLERIQSLANDASLVNSDSHWVAGEVLMNLCKPLGPAIQADSLAQRLRPFSPEVQDAILTLAETLPRIFVAGTTPGDSKSDTKPV